MRSCRRQTTCQQGNQLNCILLFSGKLLVSCAASNQIIVAHDMTEQGRLLTDLIKSRVFFFGCAVNRYTSFSSVVFLQKVTAKSVYPIILGPLVLSCTCCNPNNQRCCQINQDGNAKDCK